LPARFLQNRNRLFADARATDQQRIVAREHVLTGREQRRGDLGPGAQQSAQARIIGLKIEPGAASSARGRRGRT
jgi:hypothetical protein